MCNIISRGKGSSLILQTVVAFHLAQYVFNVLYKSPVLAIVPALQGSTLIDSTEIKQLMHVHIRYVVV